MFKDETSSMSSTNTTAIPLKNGDQIGSPDSEKYQLLEMKVNVAREASLVTSHSRKQYIDRTSERTMAPDYRF